MILALKARVKLEKDIRHWGYCFRRPYSFGVPQVWINRRLRYWARLKRISKGLKPF